MMHLGYQHTAKRHKFGNLWLNQELFPSLPSPIPPNAGTQISFSEASTGAVVKLQGQ